MNKWYRKTGVKAIVLIVAILSGAMLITNLLSLMNLAGSTDLPSLWTMSQQPFEESQEFNYMVENYMDDVLTQIRLENLFETDGMMNRNKEIDVMEYSKNDTANGENVSGIAYSLEELINWGEDFDSAESDNYAKNSVIVCQKPEGTYEYYYTSDFMTRVESGVFDIIMQDGSDVDGFLQELQNGKYTSSGFYNFDIVDMEGNILYTDCWNFGSALIEKYAPQGAENLLQVVNNSPRLNGKLSVIYDDLAYTLGNIYSDYQNYQMGFEHLEEGNTNFTYIYANNDTKKVVTNKTSYENYAELEKNVQNLISEKDVKYMVIYPKLKDFNSNMNVSKSDKWEKLRSYSSEKKWNSVFAVAVDTTYTIQDQFYQNKVAYDNNIPYFKGTTWLLVLSIILFLGATIWLTLEAGRTAEDEELHLNGFDHWKTEIAAVLIVLIWIVGSYIGIHFWNGNIYTMINDSPTYLKDGGTYFEYYYARGMDVSSAYMSASLYLPSLSIAELAEIYFYGVFTLGCFFMGYVSLIKRIKGRNLWKNSLLRVIVRFIYKIYDNRKKTTKTVLLLCGFFLVQGIAVLFRNGVTMLLVLLADVGVFYVVLNGLLLKEKLKKGIEEIALGNMEYQIPLQGLRGENLKLAEMINGIANGFHMAVEEAMKNERLKTDLITNVSHDIKTPLTSIINYVAILKQSDIADPKIQGYLDILEAKAQRLKTLTEDVVEASKVSSGNISLEYMDVDLVEMIQQTEGEMAEKFEARNLKMIVNLPAEPAVVHVDGRRMWRVLENIFGNAAKYAMPGTRVYADLKLEEDTVDLSLKNVSEHQLNISADELTERFIRGDLSRSSEGSGLGLSIAQSLTTMQGGTFNLYLDGDLFRVNIRFPRVKKQ
ncbi:sensor histidine kinase [[Ruminococcus] lactaris]|uniref:sensor histidine kinase n=1 Tax=[Ruminococcus] lactaris TaxID=46228 RepID=UPI001D05189E|nr:HAMP domain-containing sensor histidine kinase [[Ruminococcus] lactaris]MBS6150000.1 HAMP domain-containing histidine kinase [[Ruminococcus] lactaris]MCB5538209.1 HAMP domain-containing histidine kinase [[Ruminococcus] lactaris]MCB5552052.1 HAMP domain-containing histidine kinase [[Ruminococcus] lactaris]MCB5736966.1 HAMP domain-containing histidine kinase [[Ruminococcus] lactaris]MCB5830142.1 HAMP domain-containing histidine kinase [[Ruminococcus] lactaris]